MSDIVTYETTEGCKYFVDNYGDMFSVFKAYDGRLYPCGDKAFVPLYPTRESAEAVLKSEAHENGWRECEPIIPHLLKKW